MMQNNVMSFFFSNFWFIDTNKIKNPTQSKTYKPQQRGCYSIQQTNMACFHSFI